MTVASRRDVEQHAGLRAYLAGVEPRVANARSAPIAATYVGTPRFVFNPDGLVITNSLYTVTPRQKLSDRETLELVDRLNRAAEQWPRTRFLQRLSPRQFEAVDIE